jgi:transcriptional regulator with XRE-family HTH domain
VSRGGPRIAKPTTNHADLQIRIGARLRAARLARGLTIEKVSDAAGLTKGFVSRLERDDVSPSVASLVTVCEVLGLRVGALFDPPETSVVRAGEGRAINFGGEGAHEQLITPGTQEHIEIIHSLIDPGGSGGRELYTLDCEVECCYVIEGSIELRFQTGTESLSAGDAMTFPGTSPHTWRNASPTSACEVLWILAPAP